MGRTRESANLVSDKNIFVDIANDLVGVGTTAPTATLEVSGTLTVSGVSTFQSNVRLGDDVKTLFGAGNDLQIYHDGSNSYIDEQGTGDLILRGASDIKLMHPSSGETYAIFNANGAVDLYYDNSKKLATKSDGIDVTGEVQCDSLDVDGAADITGSVTLHANLDLQDNDRLRLGSSDDLQIYHDGSDSRIVDSGTGELRLDSNSLRIRNAAGTETSAVFVQNGKVELRYDNVNKFETTGGGVSVTGVATATSFSGDGSNLTNVPTGFSAINFVLS